MLFPIMETRVFWVKSWLQVCCRGTRSMLCQKERKKLKRKGSYNKATGGNIKGYWPEKAQLSIKRIMTAIDFKSFYV